MSGSRETVRAYLKVPVVVTSGSGTWTGRTRDLSRGGTLVFVEPPYPQGRCELALELPGGRLDVAAEVRFTIPGVGVGFMFSAPGAPAQARINEVVAAASATFGMWGMVGKYLQENDPRAPLRLPSPSENLFAELRASLRPGGAGARAGDLDQHTLHPVGETGAAYRVLFRRPGCVPPADSNLAATIPGFLRATQDKVKRVAPQDVWLKLHSGSQPKAYRVVELTAGGHAAVVVSQAPGAPPRVSLLTLAFGEWIATAHKGSGIFPHFTEEELEEIRLDSVGQRAREADGPAPGGTGEPVNAARFRSFVPYDEANEAELARLLREDAQSEVRKYGTRTVTLHPHILMRARDAQGGELVGVPLFDGKRHCVLQVTTEGFGRVLPLGREMSFSLVQR